MGTRFFIAESKAEYEIVMRRGTGEQKAFHGI